MLKVREDHVSSVLDEARRRLGEVTKDQAKYREILLTLIIQGLFQIMEPKTLIRCRQVDQELVKSLVNQAATEYKAKTEKDVVLTVETNSFLGADTCGGVELSALNGRIRVSVGLLFVVVLSVCFNRVTLCCSGAQHAGVPPGADLPATGAGDPSGPVRPQPEPQVHRLSSNARAIAKQHTHCAHYRNATVEPPPMHTWKVWKHTHTIHTYKSTLAK